MPAAPKDRLPWAFTVAGLVAILALHLSGKVNDLRLPFFAGFLGAAPFTSMRLPDNKIITWIVRIIIWVVLIVVSPQRHASGASVVFEPDYVHLFGCFCAAELALRAWTRTANGPSRGEALLLGALIFTCATNTYERTHIQILAPIYAVALILSLRTFSKQERSPLSDNAKHHTPRLLILRGVFVLLVVAQGFTLVYLVTEYENRITSWFVQFARHRTSRQTEIGLNNSPRLTEVFNPRATLTRVLLIDGPRGERHLRTRAYDSYIDTRWRSYLSADTAYQDVGPADLAVPAPADAKRLRITRLNEFLQFLPLPLTTAGVETSVALKRDPHGALRTSGREYDVTYDVTVLDSDVFQGPLSLVPQPLDRQRFLAMPEQVDPAIAALARKVAGDHPDALTRVRKLVMYLRSTHSYSLKFVPEGEPLSDFILNNRNAHCQYFASALVVMSRAVGVPSRFVTGYYAHEAYEDDRMVVRDRDAHAWAECWIDGVGWITMDATPSAGRPDQALVKPSKWRRLWERMQDFPGMVQAWLASITAKTWTIFILTLACAALLIAVIRWLWLRRQGAATSAAHREYATPDQALVAAARRFDRWLRRREVACSTTRTWREHVITLEDQLPQRSDALQFINTYDEARFGNVNGDTLTRLSDILDNLEQQP